jgi:hypothetical protein
MSSIIASGDSYELTKVPLFQKIGNMAVSGVIYIAVAIVGVVIGVAGATYTFEQTEIEPKIKEVAKKIGEGVENIQPETVAQVAAAITDLSKTGQDVVNVVESLAEGGNAEGGNAESKNAEGGIELSDMSKKTGLPLSVDSLTAATTGAINQKTDAVIAEQTKTVEEAATKQTNAIQEAATTNVNEQKKAVEEAATTNVNEQKKALEEEAAKQTKAAQTAVTAKLKEQTKGVESLLANKTLPLYNNLDKYSNLSNNLGKSRVNTLAAMSNSRIGGGKKTKSKRTKLTKEAKVNKPRTKKCLIQKDNKMYMSFCI